MSSRTRKTFTHTDVWLAFEENFQGRTKDHSLFVTFVRQVRQAAMDGLVVIAGLLLETFRLSVQTIHVPLELGQFWLTALSVSSLVSNILSSSGRRLEANGVRRNAATLWADDKN